MMITISKLNPQGYTVFQYQGEVVAQIAHGIVVEARWTLPARDLGYTCFEPGDRFTEYFYTDRWCNIFAIASEGGTRKGWYCNIAEPARIFDDQIEQVDLLLDVWVNAAGEALVLDEDEFAAATLSERQRVGAEQGLLALLSLIRTRQDVFADLV